MKKYQFLFLFILFVFSVFGCSLGYGKKLIGKWLSQYSCKEDTLMDIKAYEGLSCADIRYNCYKLNFKEELSLKEALIIGREEQLRASHILYALENEEGDKEWGGMILYESVDSLEEDIRAAILSDTELRKNNPNTKIKITIAGFQVVGSSKLLAKAKKPDSLFALEKYDF